MTLDSSQKNGVMLYGGKAYAVGLLWLTIQEDQPKELFSQRLKKAKADYHCIRTHIAQQQGFGWLDKGHRRGMPAAAAMIADQLVGEWHGVFEADNGWWYVQVRSDTITPQGDRFFINEEEAYHHFQNEMRSHTWPYAYAPSRWELNDTTIRHLELKNVLDGLTTTTLVADNISAIFGGKSKRNLILGMIILCLVGMGGFTAYSITKPPEQIVLPPPKMLPIKPQIVKIEPPKADQALIILPEQFVSACGEVLSSLFVTLPGWEAQTFTCQPNRSSFVWSQKTGSLSEAQIEGQKQWPSTVGINFNNKQLNVTAQLAQLPTSEQTDLYTQEQALIYTEQYLQPKGSLQIKIVTPPPPKPIKVKPANQPLVPKPDHTQKPLAFLEIQMNSQYAPNKILGFFQAKGLELRSINWLINRSEWQYQLRIFYKSPAMIKEQNKTVTPSAGASVNERGKQK